MKYADAPGTQAEVVIAAPPERVWPWVIDIRTSTRFSPELFDVQWVDEQARPELGATFVGRNRNAALGTWQTVSRITQLEPRRRFAWQVCDLEGRFEVPAAQWAFELLPEGDGTVLRQSVRIGPGSSGVSLAIAARPELEEQIVKGRIRSLNDAMRTTLEGIRGLVDRCETPAP